MLRVIYSFTGNNDGFQPAASLIQGMDGNLYGTTAGHGGEPGSDRSGFGSVFALIPPGSAPAFRWLNPIKYPEPNGTLALAPVVFASPPLSYQWMFNGVPISYATNAVLTLTNFSPDVAGGYSLFASNYAGVATSTVARVPYFGLNLSAAATNFPLLTIGDVPGSRYQIDYSTNLAVPNSWNTLASVALTNGQAYIADPAGVASIVRFYRAVPLP